MGRGKKNIGGASSLTDAIDLTLSLLCLAMIPVYLRHLQAYFEEQMFCWYFERQMLCMQGSATHSLDAACDLR